MKRRTIVVQRIQTNLQCCSIVDDGSSETQHLSNSNLGYIRRNTASKYYCSNLNEIYDLAIHTYTFNIV